MQNDQHALGHALNLSNNTEYGELSLRRVRQVRNRNAARRIGAVDEFLYTLRHDVNDATLYWMTQH